MASAGRAGSGNMNDEGRAGRSHKSSPKSQKRLERALCNKRLVKRLVTPPRLTAKFNVHPKTIQGTAKGLLQMTPVGVEYVR